MRRQFEIWGHGRDRTMVGIVAGETLGEIIENTVKRFGLTFKAIHGLKLEVDGLIIKLKETTEEAVQ